MEKIFINYRKKYIFRTYATKTKSVFKRRWGVCVYLLEKIMKGGLEGPGGGDEYNMRILYKLLKI